MNGKHTLYYRGEKFCDVALHCNDGRLTLFGLPQLFEAALDSYDPHAFELEGAGGKREPITFQHFEHRGKSVVARAHTSMSVKSALRT